MASRLILYGAVSTLGAASVIGSALHTRANFYAAAVAVGRSSGALMVLANFALFNTICFGIVVKTIFFGRLRSIEYEHLFERLWLFLTESLLALTIFRDDFSAPFALMYGVLLFLKCFHWITADRVDYMDQVPPPGPPTLFHIRCSLIIGLLTLIDCALVIYSLESIVVDGVSAMVLFGSEFMILLASIGGTSARYIVGLIDLRRARGREDAPSWEEKSMYLFYIDLGVDFVKLLTYLTFFLVILLNYGLPLHILRDVYMTLRSFLSRCSDLVRYRRATRDMDSLYPNATTEDIERNGDRTCIICREEMVPHQTAAERAAASADGAAAVEGGPNETPKRLQCGHIFHFHCLRSWLERQQSCPTCRRDVLHAPVAPRRTNGVNVQINPPPPAPGALPRANAPPGAPNPIQAVYDQYFRPPQPAPAAHPPHPAPTPGPTYTESSAAPAPDAQIQRGIWGGPITPGRFFAAPLGAAPAWPQSTAGARSDLPTLATRSQGIHMPIIRLPEVPSASSSSTATPPARDDSREEYGASTSSTHDGDFISSQPEASGSQTPNMMSGSNTPHTSNPPQIFLPAGTSVSKEQDGEGEGGGARKSAAEAALRRMGLRSGGPPRLSPLIPISAEVMSSFPLGLEDASNIDPVEVSHADDGARGRTRKGKARAIFSNQIQGDDDPLSKPPTALPYLTLPGHDLLNQKDRSGAIAGSEKPSTMRGTMNALEDRLRVLKEVDEVVWGLVGELTRMKSSWEREEGDDAISDRE